MEEHNFLIKQFCQPAEVYFNNQLSRGAKALFPLIVILDHKVKGCFASNAYLAGISGVVVRSVERFISELIELGYITRELITQKDGSTKRIIRIDHEYKKKYANLIHNVHCERIWNVPEEMILDDTEGGCQPCHPPLATLSPPPDSFVIQKEYISERVNNEKTNDLLRKSSLSSHNGPDGPKEQVRSKLIRKPVIQSKLLRSKSSIIKNTPVTPPEVKPKTELNLSLELIEIVNEWEDGLKIHAHSTKTFKQAIFSIVKLLNGKMFNSLPQFKDYHNRKFTVQEIITAISNFKLAALSPDYHPIGNLKERFRKTLFPDFFYNPHAMKYQSLFIEFLNNPPKSVIENTRLIPDVYPQLSKKLRKLYVENVLGNPDAKLLPQSENAFRRAALKLSNFMEMNKKRILITEVNGNLANYLWEALENRVKNTSEITPIWFCSDITFNETFPAYLYSQGVLQSMNEKEFSIYN
jgi:hypothetical protein